LSKSSNLKESDGYSSNTNRSAEDTTTKVNYEEHSYPSSALHESSLESLADAIPKKTSQNVSSLPYKDVTFPPQSPVTSSSLDEGNLLALAATRGIKIDRRFVSPRVKALMSLERDGPLLPEYSITLEQFYGFEYRIDVTIDVIKEIADLKFNRHNIARGNKESSLKAMYHKFSGKVDLNAGLRRGSSATASKVLGSRILEVMEECKLSEVLDVSRLNQLLKEGEKDKK
jgi:hypothetical protein